MAPRSRPSFFKILLDPSVPHLPLPSAFVSKHLENKIPENTILRSINGGFSWRLKIKQIDGVYCFADGWINVVKDIQLGYGDFLVFRLVDPSTFNVSIFSANGCEKEFYSKIKVEHDKDAVVHEEEDLDDDDVVHENDVDNNDEDEDEDEDDEYEEEDGGGRARARAHVRDRDGDDEEEEEDDDEDDDDEEEEEEEEDGGCEEEDGDEDDEEEEDDGDGDIDGDDGDPFFMIVISKTHQHLMRLPPKFMRLAGIHGERRIRMKNPDDKEWQMRLRSEKQQNRYYLTSGWSEFYQSNELSEGDKCVFKFIKSEDKLSLAKVTRKRARPVARDSQTDGTKRKRGRTAGEECGRGEVNREDEHAEEEVVKRQEGRQLRQKSGVVYF